VHQHGGGGLAAPATAGGSTTVAKTSVPEFKPRCPGQLQRASIFLVRKTGQRRFAETIEGNLSARRGTPGHTMAPAAGVSGTFPGCALLLGIRMAAVLAASTTAGGSTTVTKTAESGSGIQTKVPKANCSAASCGPWLR